jgi:hypothetical protein
MPTNQAYPSLNDIEPSWSDIQIAITPVDGTALDAADISGIKCSGKVEVGTRKGTSGGRIMARTTGEVSYEASATFYRSGLRKLVDALIAAAPDYALRGNQVRISLIAFDVDIQHTPPGEERIYHWRLKGCRLLGYSSDMKEGNEADSLELTLNPIENVEIVDGKEVVLL